MLGCLSCRNVYDNSLFVGMTSVHFAFPANFSLSPALQSSMQCCAAGCFYPREECDKERVTSTGCVGSGSIDRLELGHEKQLIFVSL